MQVPIKEIRVKEGRRRLDMDHVKELADSIRELGLLNPVTIDKGKNLIAGLHRLEAAKILGWTGVECTVSSLEGLEAELAEIDENIVRSDLSALEYGEILLRRKEIYEALHPETKKGGDRKSEEIKAKKFRFDSDQTKSFAQDTADKLGVTKRTVELQLQTAKNLTPEAKEIMRESGEKFTRRTALELSRLEPEKQREAAGLLAAREIQSVGEYRERGENHGDGPGRETTEETEKEAAGTDRKGSRTEGHGASLREVIAELKDPDKDCSGTPESFLEEFAAFVQKFRREMEWYDDPYYDTVYPYLDREQLERLRGLTDSVSSAVKGLYKRIEKQRKPGQRAE